MDPSIVLQTHNIPVCGVSLTPTLQPDRSSIQDLLNSAKQPRKSLSQINTLSHMLKSNKIFQQLPFSSKQIEEVAAEVDLIKITEACKLPIVRDQILLVLEGEAFEYIQNQAVLKNRRGSARSASSKSQEYALIRKIHKNQYFCCYIPKSKYDGAQRKMQVVADSGGIIARVGDTTFHKFFEKKLEFYMQESFGLLKGFQILRDLSKNLLFELSKYIVNQTYPSGTVLYRRGDKSDYMYFLQSGTVILRDDRGLELNKLEKKFKVKNSTASSLLLQAGGVVGVDGIILNANDDIRQYSAECVSEVSVWRIDKRPLIVLISTYNEGETEVVKANEVNLNQQVDGKEFERPDREILQDNVRKIQTSEKKVRDIKLRMGTNKSNRKSTTNVYRKGTVGGQVYIEELRGTARTAQFPVPNQLHTRSLSGHFVKPQMPQIQLSKSIAMSSMHSWFNQPQKSVNNLVITTVDPDPILKLRKSNTSWKAQSPQQQKKIQNRSSSKIIKSASTTNYLGKQEREMITTYIERKRSNQLKARLIAVHNFNQNQKQKQSIKVRRLFHSKGRKNPDYDLPKPLEDTLYTRMQNLKDNPLLFQLESRRKKILQISNSPVHSSVKSTKASQEQVKENYSSKILIRDME